jgi:hypothetical protein
MDILKAATVPAVLTLLFSGVGWLFDHSIQRFENVLFLSYSTGVEVVDRNSQFWIEVENQSAASTFTNVDVLVHCQSDRPCLKAKQGGAEDNKFLTYVAIPPVVVSSTPIDDTKDFVSAFRIDFLPVGARARFIYLLANPTEVPRLWFQFPDLKTNTISVYNGPSAAAWLASNYYKLLFGALIVLTVAIIVYFVWLGWSARKQSSDAEKLTTYRLVHSINGDPVDYRRE